MYRIKGLKDYIEGERFRNALNIPLDYDLKVDMLAQGEYNINFCFTHPVTNKDLVLRVNTGSQMHLDNQIEYEYNALKSLEGSMRTPKVYYVDGSLSNIDFGVLVMEFLNGISLDYNNDLHIASTLLSDIHSVNIDGMDLISPSSPLEAMLEECETMGKVYLEYEDGEEEVKSRIEFILDYSRKLIENEKDYTGRRCCINTELNSGNFLINREGQSYIIDWEKPIIGEAVQDIAHFLAPTTTFWKTDIILSKEEIQQFLSDYKEAVNGRFDTSDLNTRLKIYMPLTCLRGITWCSMAYVEYQNPNKIIQNEFTYNKIKSYLSIEFLDKIISEYFI